MQGSIQSYRESHSANEYGSLYSRTYQQGYYFYQWNYLEKPLIEKIFLAQRTSGTKKYLDFACGTGRILSVAENYFDQTFGVDVSETMLAIARKTCVNSRILKMDLTKQSFPETFELVTAFRFFLNAEDELRLDVLHALYDLLDDHGTLIANIHVNKMSPLGCVYRLRNWALRKKIANTLGYSEFKTMLESCGFEVKHVYWYSYLPRTGWRMEWLAKYLIQHVDSFWEKVPFLPKEMAQSFLVVCKRI